MINKITSTLEDFYYSLGNKEKRELLKVKKERLTYLRSADLLNLYETARQVENEGVPGVFVEAGCALGGSAIIIAKAKANTRPFRIYDVFGRIPPPSENDDQDVHERYEEIVSGVSQGIGGDEYYGYKQDLMTVVQTNLAVHGVPVQDNHIELVKGKFEDTMHLDGPVAFAHIDCDWYESVKTCVHAIAPHLSIGGKMVFDDYFEWSGCRKAVDEYFQERESQFRKDVVGKKIHMMRIG